MTLDYYIIIRNNENKIRPDQIAESNFSLHMNNETGLLTGDGLTLSAFKEEDEESVFSNSSYPDVCVSFRIDKFESNEKGVAAMLNILFWVIRNVNEDMILYNEDQAILQSISDKLIFEKKAWFWIQSKWSTVQTDKLAA